MSIMIIFILSVETLSTRIVFSHSFILRFQLVVCCVFMADFFARLAFSDRKLHFFICNLPLFIVSIPYLNIIDWANFDITHQTHLILRTIPLIRGIYGLVIMISWITRNKVYNLFFSYVITLVGVTYYSSLIFYTVEKDVNPMVKQYWDSLWWACMDVTTVGSNIYGVTGMGQFLAAALAGVGMMLFPIFTAYIIKVYEKEQTKMEHLKS